MYIARAQKLKKKLTWSRALFPFPGATPLPLTEPFRLQWLFCWWLRLCWFWFWFCWGLRFLILTQTKPTTRKTPNEIKPPAKIPPIITVISLLKNASAMSLSEAPVKRPSIYYIITFGAHRNIKKLPIPEENLYNYVWKMLLSKHYLVLIWSLKYISKFVQNFHHKWILVLVLVCTKNCRLNIKSI